MLPSLKRARSPSPSNLEAGYENTSLNGDDESNELPTTDKPPVKLEKPASKMINDINRILSGRVDTDVAMKKIHLSLLEKRPELDELNEIKSAPLFTEPVRRYAHSLAGHAAQHDKPFSQYGLLGGEITAETTAAADPRIFWNITAPSSVFICGSQGSGKSHNLACLLENCLAPCPANVLPHPLTGIVFHYDTFISDTGGSPCEVAWLSSNPDIKVRVLCPPTNIGIMRKLYAQFPRITVHELRLNEYNLNTQRMLDLMAITSGSSGSMPLYMTVVSRILRELRIAQQQTGAGFDYSAFKQRLNEEELTDMQMAPLKQRLDTLESFMVDWQAKAVDLFTARARDNNNNNNGVGQRNKKQALPSKASTGQSQATISWAPESGQLTIVDLSCPCVTAEMACSLFNICLSLFLEQDPARVSRIVALDEAHKYMNNESSAECQTLTENLLATIRLQRHLGARVIVSTQEPTVSPKLLDLCSVTAVHRFTSPDWLRVLGRHLAGCTRESVFGGEDGEWGGDEEDEDEDGEGVGMLAGVGGEEEKKKKKKGGDPMEDLFSKIVGLKVGEALVFAPSAIVGVNKKGNNVQRLAHGILKVCIRNRTTADGGKSIMAV